MPKPKENLLKNLTEVMNNSKNASIWIISEMDPETNKVRWNALLEVDNVNGKPLSLLVDGNRKFKGKDETQQYIGVALANLENALVKEGEEPNNELSLQISSDKWYTVPMMSSILIRNNGKCEIKYRYNPDNYIICEQYDTYQNMDKYFDAVHEIARNPKKDNLNVVRIRHGAMSFREM